MRIHVTQRDINKGCRSASNNCPIARAINRATWFTRRSVVAPGSVYTFSRFLGIDRTAELPEIANKFIAKFDSYGPESVAPFSFEITLKQKSN